MWIFKVKNVKIQDTTKSFIVMLFYKINPTKNTTNITNITENSLNLVPHTNLKIGEKFSLFVYTTIQHNLKFLFPFSYSHKIPTHTGVQSEQLIAHNSPIVARENMVSVTNMQHSFYLCTQ